MLIHVQRCIHIPQKFHEVMSILNMCTELWGFFFLFCVILSKVFLTHEIDIMTYQRGGIAIWAIQISSYLLIWQMRIHQAGQELEHSTLNSDREANTLSEPLHGLGRYQASSDLSWIIRLCSLFVFLMSPWKAQERGWWHSTVPFPAHFPAVTVSNTS